MRTQPDAFAHIPAYALSDPIMWIQFVIQRWGTNHSLSREFMYIFTYMHAYKHTYKLVFMSIVTRLDL